MHLMSIRGKMSFATMNLGFNRKNSTVYIETFWTLTLNQPYVVYLLTLILKLKMTENVQNKKNYFKFYFIFPRIEFCVL